MRSSLVERERAVQMVGESPPEIGGGVCFHCITPAQDKEDKAQGKAGQQARLCEFRGVPCGRIRWAVLDSVAVKRNIEEVINEV